MRFTRVLLPIVFGLFISFGLVAGFAQAGASASTGLLPTANIVYVDADAAGAATGVDWTNAYTTLQDALTVAISGTEIWVAEGIYYPDDGSGQMDDVLTSTFVLTDGVAIYGGFAATETLRTQRNWESNVTVLSGDIDHETAPDLTDSHGVVTTTENLSGTNAYHVVSSFGVTTTAIVDGFSITAGQAEGFFSSPCEQECGGGMINWSGSPTLNNLVFSGNSAFGDGAGMYNTMNSHPALTNVTFSGNAASYGGSGGGIYNDLSNPTLVDVTFSNNSVGQHGGGMYNWESSPTLENVIFFNNLAEVHGGAMTNWFYSSPTLVNVTILSNTAVWGGGGMYNTIDCNPMLKNVTFTGNVAGAGSDGGGMFSDSDSSPVLINVTFSANSAGDDGGGMYNSHATPTLMNVTFAGNSAEHGGGMFNWDNDSTLVNTIFWGNTADISGTQIINYMDLPTISHSDIQGSGGSGMGWDASLGVDGGGNIDADPLFVQNPDPEENDYGDLHLLPGSPAIDAGTNSGCPATDLDGNPRPVNATCDMGAYETGYALSLSKMVDNPSPEPGQTITFTIVVSNSGLDVTGGVISDALPAGLNFLGPVTLEPMDAGLVGATPLTLVSELVISYTESITLTFPVTVSYELEAGTQIVNTASISSTEVITPVMGSVALTIAEVPDDFFIYLPVVIK